MMEQENQDKESIADELKEVESLLRPFGLGEGEFIVPDDFDEPLPESLIDEFEGG